MQSLFKAISLTGIEFLFLQALGFPRKKFYYEENILENQIIHFSLPFCHARFLKSTNFTLSSLVLALFLSSNVAYAAGEVTIGNNASASPYGVAIGDDANASGSGSGGVAIGGSASVKKNLGIAVGELTEARGESSVVIGAFGIADGKQSVALGANSRAKNDDEVNIGIWSNDGLKLYGTRTLSGLSAGTKDDEAVNKKQLDTAIASISGGVSAADAQKMADTAQSDAVTTANEHTDTEISKVLNSGSSTTKNAFAIGQDATATGEISTATGQNAQATGNGSTATGQAAIATGPGSTATGQNAQATGNGSTATGQAAIATGPGSTATGQNAQAKGKNSVALGANSVADKDNQVSIGQKITDATTGAVSYITRTLSNLTDGTDAHDAVNKGQLDTAKSDAISTANKYTDSSITGLKLDEKLSTADSNAQKYATSAQTAANKYTDDTVSKVNEKALKEANTYTDDTAKKTLKTASENTERRALIAENNAVTRSNTYTDESSSRTLESANTYTNHRATQAENNAVARSNNYTDNRFGELKNQVDRNEKRANGGIAGAMAMTAIPSVPGHNFSFGMAASGYRDQGAIAAGVKANITQDTTVSLNTAWDSGNGVGVAAGFSVGW
ncbi:YadA-like family protein [Salmonella enterica]